MSEPLGVLHVETVCFVCRQHKNDPLVLERERYVREAFQHEVRRVPRAVLDSWKFSDADQMLTLITAVIADVFKLPGQGAKEGSDEWIRSVFKTDSFSFENLIQHRKLLHKFFRKFEESLPNNGQLPLRPGEVVPNRNYTRSKSYDYLPTGKSGVLYDILTGVLYGILTRVLHDILVGVLHDILTGVSHVTLVLILSNAAHRSLSYVHHPHLTFLRRVHVQKAITQLRNMGLYAFKTSKDSMPPGEASVDNFAQFKTVFHIWYCYYEGSLFTCETSVTLRVHDNVKHPFRLFTVF